jgi:hypothetical protein
MTLVFQVALAPRTSTQLMHAPSSELRLFHKGFKTAELTRVNSCLSLQIDHGEVPLCSCVSVLSAM